MEHKGVMSDLCRRRQRIHNHKRSMSEWALVQDVVEHGGSTHIRTEGRRSRYGGRSRDNYKQKKARTITIAWRRTLTLRSLDSIGGKRICTVTLIATFRSSHKCSTQATGQHPSAVILIAVNATSYPTSAQCPF